jgi:hypothetical protein
MKIGACIRLAAVPVEYCAECVTRPPGAVASGTKANGSLAILG